MIAVSRSISRTPATSPRLFSSFFRAGIDGQPGKFDANLIRNRPVYHNHLLSGKFGICMCLLGIPQYSRERTWHESCAAGYTDDLFLMLSNFRPSSSSNSALSEPQKLGSVFFSFLSLSRRVLIRAGILRQKCRQTHSNLQLAFQCSTESIGPGLSCVYQLTSLYFSIS